MSGYVRFNWSKQSMFLAEYAEPAGLIQTRPTYTFFAIFEKFSHSLTRMRLGDAVGK